MKKLLKKIVAIVMCASMMASSMVTSFAAEATKVEFGKDKAVVELDERSAAFKAIANGTGTITYTSSDTTIATVGENGIITPKKTGKVTITAKTSETVKDTIEIEIVDSYEVWVNGKDVKANSKKGITADLNKTCNIPMAALTADANVQTFAIEEVPTGVTLITALQGKTSAMDKTVVTKPGTLTYTKTAVAKKQDAKYTVAIPDSTKVPAGTYKYVPAVAADESAGTAAVAAHWVDTQDATKKIEESALTITPTEEGGKAAKDDQVEVKMVWVAEGTDFAVTNISATTTAVEEGTVITIVNNTQNGLSTSLAKGKKYIYSVVDKPETNTAANKYEDVFSNGKGTKSAKASVKFDKKTNSFKVTAGKEKGDVEVWIAEYDSKAKAITAYAKADVSVYLAPKKFTVEIPEVKDSSGNVTKEAIQKSTTANVGNNITLKVKTSDPSADDITASTSYTWSVKAPKGETAVVVSLEDAAVITAGAANNATDAQKAAAKKINDNIAKASVVVRETQEGTASVEFKKLANATKTANYTITCVNDQSQKKASFKATVANGVKNIVFAGSTFTIKNAYTDKQTASVKIGTAEKFIINTDATVAAADGKAITTLATTDKVQVFVSSETTLSTKTNGVITEAKGFDFEVGEKKDKFKLTSKSKEFSAKLDKKTGSLTVTVKKGTLPGTQAKLIFVVTHKNGKIDVYEELICVDYVAKSITGTTAQTVEVGKSISLVPTVTPEVAGTTPAVVWTTSDKKIATVDAKGKVIGVSAGSCEIICKNGKTELKYTVTVNEKAAASSSANS